jgi:hypothetical protein
MWRTILKGDPGKLFKGNSFNLVQSEAGLYLSQSYFSPNQYRAEYKIKSNITINEHKYYPVSLKIPKWYQEIFKRFKALGMPRKAKVNCKELKLSLVIDESFAALEYYNESNGIDFKNHYYNIEVFKQLRNRWRIVSAHLKQITDEEFASFNIPEVINEENAERILELPKDILHK